MDKKSKSHPFSILSLLACAKCNSIFVFLKTTKPSLA